MTAQATILEELADEVTLLVEWLREGTKPGSAGREFANGLQRDLFVLEQATARGEPPTDHAAWVAAFLESFVAKLVLGGQLMPKAGDRLRQSSTRLVDLQGRNALLATLRKEALPFLAEVSLASPARAYLERTQALETVCLPSLLRRSSGPPPEMALAARLMEGIGLHLAYQHANGQSGASDEELSSLARRIEGWLGDLGAQAEAAATGRPAPDGACQLETPGRVAGAPKGTVIAALTPGVTLEGGQRLAQPVVVVSAGAESHLAGAVRAALGKAPEGQRKSLAPAVDAAARGFDQAQDDQQRTPAERGQAAMELIDAVRPLIEADPRALDPMLAALSKDLGAQASVILAAPGSPAAPGPELTQVAVFSPDVPPGQVVALLRPGLRLGKEVARPALAQVSSGEPPPGILDEVLELLPADDPRAAHLRVRLERARCLSAGDAGAALARELADLALFMRDDALGDAARRALRLVIDEPPAELSGKSGWEAVRELLAEHLESLFDDGESGQLAAFRLVRPWLQGLRTGSLAGARLRSLGESMDALLSLFDEGLAATTRAWLFSQLERLGGEGLGAGSPGGGGHAARLARTVSKKIRSFYENQEVTPALELTQALQRSGLLVFPAEAEKLELCPDPEALFHRLETVYSDDPRGKVMGSFEPAVVAGQTMDAPKETGAVTVSLGKEPPALAWLKGNAIRSSRLAAAGPRLAQEIAALDKRRFLGELKGDAGAERRFVGEAAQLVTAALEEAGWQRGDDDRHALGRLFELLGEDFRLEVLPGYLSYRRLRELQQAVGPELQVEIVREGAKRITLQKIGALWRDDLLAPLAMVWCTGPPPEYVGHLRQIPWIAAVLDGKQPPIEVPPATRDAILDFDSPDAQSVDGVVRSLTTIVTWLATEVPGELGRFTQVVKNAPGLEFTFFPLPGQTYPREQLLAALERSDTPDSLEVVRDAAREDGQVVHVDRIAIYQKGKRLSEEPRARFALKSVPKEAETFLEALEPLFKSAHVPGSTKAELKGHATRLALLPVGEGQRDVELKAFKTLLAGRMVDPSYAAKPDNALHGAAAYLAGRLESAGLLKVERFEGKKQIADALAGVPKDGAELDLVFCMAGAPELVAVKRPFVTLEGQTIQKAFLLQGVPTGDAPVLEFDQVMLDSLDRMRLWVDGPGALIDPSLDQTKRVVVPRTIQRLQEIRKKMFDAHAKKKPVMPPDTQVRDLIRFVIDQVHRAEDIYALLPDKTYRGSFGELVFTDVVFRAMGPYLAKRFNQTVDTSVVAGADTQALVGKFKLETTGPRPKRENMKVYSVVTPAFSQDGVCIRPATVRVGDYD